VVSGFYQWSAILFDSLGTQLGFAAGSGIRTAGTAAIPLSFDGRAIGMNDQDSIPICAQRPVGRVN
jgi:hypothetical protein